MNDPPAIAVERAVKRFGPTAALAGVTLAILPGRLHFLLGPSGCGKTTLLRAIAGFTPLDSGAIRLAGVDVSPLPPEKRATGMVFQNYALWPHLTAAQNITFGLDVLRVPRREQQQRLAEILATAGLEGAEGKKPGQLSGGQQQRVALARALITRPRCLLLDEPLANLDTQLRHTMRSEIRRICKAAGITALYVTHDQKEALSEADSISVMRAGRIEQTADPVTLYRRPANRFVATFLGGLNTFTLHGELHHLRPEALIPTPTGDPATLCEITAAHYLGDSIAYRLTLLQDGTPIAITQPNPRAFLPPGTRTRFTFDPADRLTLE